AGGRVLECRAEDLLAFPRDLLGLATGRHVQQEALRLDQPAVRLELRDLHVVHPDHAAVGGDHAVLRIEPLAREGGGVGLRHHAVSILVVDSCGPPVGAVPVIRREAEKLLDLRAHVDRLEDAGFARSLDVRDERERLDELPVPRLGGTAVADVASDSLDADGHAVLVCDPARHFDGNDPAVPGEELEVVDGLLDPAAQLGAGRVGRLRAPLRSDEVDERAADDLVERQPDQALECRIEVRDQAYEVGPEDEVFGVVEDRAQPRLALTEGGGLARRGEQIRCGGHAESYPAIASTSSDRAQPLMRNLLAPASAASLCSVGSSQAESITIRACGASGRMRRAASIPPTPGMRTSRTIVSGRSDCVSATASAPSAATPTTSSPSSARTCDSTVRTASSSSTTRTRCAIWIAEAISQSIGSRRCTH